MGQILLQRSPGKECTAPVLPLPGAVQLERGGTSAYYALTMGGKLAKGETRPSEMCGPSAPWNCTCAWMRQTAPPRRDAIPAACKALFPCRFLSSARLREQQRQAHPAHIGPAGCITNGLLFSGRQGPSQHAACPSKLIKDAHKSCYIAGRCYPLPLSHNKCKIIRKSKSMHDMRSTCA